MSAMQEIKTFFLNNKCIDTSNDLDESDSLLENGIIDSVGMLELVDYLEEKFSIQIDEDDLMPENFDSLTAINDYVSSKIK
ncbi:MAG: acyl carrier protein [Deltaproteobacteria bacterium]|nr:acyl carrier protein [Deltaproteobacteria bacterium]